jgi:hypothetical protein
MVDVFYTLDMELTSFLAQLMGFFIVIMGASMLLRREVVVHAVEDIFSSRGTAFLIGLLEVIGGLLLVLNHSIWTGNIAIVVTLLGWLMLFEGIMYITVSEKTLKEMIVWLHKKRVYYVFCGIYILIGFFLLYGSYFLV